MFKFYRRTDDGLLYREAWANGFNVVEHWGRCGERGEVKEHAAESSEQVALTLGSIANDALQAGFKPISEKRMKMLIVEYPIENAMSEAVQRRHQLEDQFNELVGWLGLGHLDGGSIGSGTMEVALVVVDFEIARVALEKATVGTVLAGFTRIYKMT
jgi:hypothetical protein